MTDFQMGKQYAGNVNASPVVADSMTPPPIMAPRTREGFLYGLCVCCKDCDSCLEAWCCTRCQMSRQCNMMMKDKPEIDWLTCTASYVVDYLCTGGILAFVFVCQTRRMARERYGIAGGCCRDCCLAWLCSQCATQQILLEMAARGDFPGACCYEIQHLPITTNMY